MNTQKLLKKIGTVLAIGAIGVSTVALAHGGDGKGHRGPRGMGGGQGIEKMAEKLGLSADQKTKIQAIRDQFQKDNAGNMAEIKKLHEQMKTYAQSKDQANMKATREQIKAKMDAMKPARERMQQQINAVLTAEQRAQIEKMKADRQAKQGERKGRRGQKGEGKAEID